jgi:hypothetical protein
VAGSDVLEVLQLEEGKGKVRHEPSGEEKAAALHMKGWGGWRRYFTRFRRGGGSPATGA